MPEVNRHRLFGSEYPPTERQMVEAVASSRINMTSFVKLVDVFDDRLLDAVFRTDGTLGKYNF